ncbi:MAG: alkaline phosphatase family protein, partial [Ginsengibacter sp.]
MKNTLIRHSVTLLLLAITHASFAQILTYTNATNGSLSSVAANTTGTNLSRVNGASVTASPCNAGFSTSNFSSTRTYSSSLAAVEVSVKPNSGFSLNVTGFTADLGRSASGPASIRFAYSVNGGSTWTNQTSNQSTQSGRCGKVHTILWSTSVKVTAPATLKFRIYGFNANKTSGTEQVLNLKINGSVASSVSCGVATGLSAGSITSSSAALDWNDVSGATGYNIQYRKTGTTTWTSKTSTTSSTAVSGLTASTPYEFQVQTVCTGGITSAFSSSATFTTTSSTVTNPVPAFTHIVVVIGENTNASSVFGNSNAPYINTLAAIGAKFTNSFAITHPSQPNYLQLYSGSNQGITDDSYITTKFTTANLGKELINAGKTYTSYSEGLPSVGYDGATSGLYVRRHNPAANWMGTGTNQIPTTTNQPFTAFPTNYNNLPSVSFVIPNLCSDGHDVCAPLNNST